MFIIDPFKFAPAEPTTPPYTPPTGRLFNNTVMRRDITTEGSKRLATYSFWLAPQANRSYRRIYSVSGSSNREALFMGLHNSDTFEFGYHQGTTLRMHYRTRMTFPQAGGRRHFLIQVNSNNSGNMASIHIDGVEITSYAIRNNHTGDLPMFPINEDFYVGANSEAPSRDRLRGRLQEAIAVDGANYGPETFGETRGGSWVPKLPTGITYGTNGFYLDFADTSNFNNDVSGNNNDFT